MNASIDDIAEVRRLSAIWALRLTQGDIHPVMEQVFTPDGTYSAFGQTYGLEDWPALVEAAPSGLFLTGEPVIELDVDTGTGTGEVPMLFIDQTNHHMRMGWYTDTYERMPDGWRLKTRGMTFLRRHGGADSGKPHDPLRPEPTSSA